MESPETKERKGASPYSWNFTSSIHSSIMIDEDLMPARKLNVIHFACIGVFLIFAACSVAATIYAFVS